MHMLAVKPARRIHFNATIQCNDSKFTAWDQDILKKDNDTRLEFAHTSDGEISWHVFANKCVFSCDKIWLQVKYRTGPA